MNIVVICQEDNFVIPKNILKLKNIKDTKLISVIEISSKGALTNKKGLFLRGFGFLQFLKLGAKSIKGKLLDLLDFIFLRKFKFLMSIKSVALFLNASFLKVKDINSSYIIQFLKDKDIDLVISFSAPCIFKKELLDLPKKGCINLHCSVLPEFSGLLPSFWTLYEETDFIGATIHMMDSKIDNGDILDQVKIKTPKNISIYQNIKITKEMGGDLMVSVIENIKANKIKKIENKYDEKKYRTWPSVEQMNDFRKKGGKLV